MIDDCEAGNIDMIITKSISRFARNTLDCLKYIRQLKDKNIPVFFEKEAINTMDAKGEILITIMASLAQQESQSLSQNVKLGLQFRYQNGQVQVNHNHFLGYTKDADGNLIIDPEQAEVVKRIYREYLEGYSMDRIAKGLEADGILTGAGKTKWWTSTINKILRNEKYIGDALLQKTYTTDFLNKTRVKNNGIVPQYYVEGNHEAIIPKDIFLQVQEELVRKAENLVKGLGFHFRTVKLAAGDCSASMARTYDIEIQIPSMNGYKEVSSVSNARDYQARRGNIRFRREATGKPEFVHTLNGSGLATSRIFPAIVEQNQRADGSIVVPEVLRKYLGGIEVIEKK